MTVALEDLPAGLNLPRGPLSDISHDLALSVNDASRRSHPLAFCIQAIDPTNHRVQLTTVLINDEL